MKMNYFEIDQSTWNIADNISANWFAILCKMNNLNFEVFAEEFFYRFEISGKYADKIKLKYAWDARKEINQPMNICDYMIANRDANKVLESYEVVTIGEGGLKNGFPLRITGDRQPNYEINGLNPVR